MNYAAALIDQLVLQGVTLFCIAPGSRSTPLALAAAEHPEAETVVHFDERGLAFYALGFGKGKKKPAAIIVTSGTAVANLFPATMEAFHSNTPLILLTADRPQELRDCGSNQTTDQVKLFSNVICWQQDLSPHLDATTVRSIGAQAVFQSLWHKGPIHLNCPFKEPLYPPPARSYGKKIDFFLPQLIAPPVHSRARRGIILLGDTDADVQPVLHLAKRLKWPIFADLLSQARRCPTEEQISHFDFLIRSWEGPEPDLLLHFGKRFISKFMAPFSKNTPLIHISSHPTLNDPERRLSTRVLSDILPFCESFVAETDLTWLTTWQEANKKVQKETTPFTEIEAITTLTSHAPLFFGNSMPIRHADQFFFPNPCPPIFANRGVFGIDGNIATAAGIAHALQKPVTIFIGDQTALHDLNSLPLIKKHKLRLIISNNFGGAIFNHLPVAKSPHLKTLFTAEHSWSFEGAAQMFGIPYEKKEGPLDNLPSWGIVELLTHNQKVSMTFLPPPSPQKGFQHYYNPITNDWETVSSCPDIRIEEAQKRLNELQNARIQQIFDTQIMPLKKLLYQI